MWGNSPHSQLYSLEVALKKTVRVMTFCGYYDHTSPLFNNLGLLKLNNIRIYMSLLYVYKSLQKGSSLFVRYHHNAHYTRANNLSLVQLPNVFSTHSRRGIRWTGVELWNVLPLGIRRAPCYDAFKRQVKQYLLTQQAGILTPGGCGVFGFGFFCGEPLS